MIGNASTKIQSTEYVPGTLVLYWHGQEVFGTEYSELDVSYYITAFEMFSSIFAVLAIIFWRWRTNVTVEKVCRMRLLKGAFEALLI